MKPIEKAKALYVQQGVSFEEQLYTCLTSIHGGIISTPTCFAMGYAVTYEGNKHAWFIDVAVGRLSDLLKALPFKLPYIAFYRHKGGTLSKLKLYPTEKLLRLSV